MKFLPHSAGRASPTRISGRNQLHGTVVEVIAEGLLAKVVLAVGPQRVTAIITADAVQELGIKKGEEALALIKATEVMIGKPWQRANEPRSLFSSLATVAYSDPKAMRKINTTRQAGQDRRWNLSIGSFQINNQTQPI